MTGFDRRGPFGCGPMTGRGFGPCGRGRGLGRMRWQDAPSAQSVELTAEEQKKILQAELDEIEAEKHAIEKRLKEMK